MCVPLGRRLSKEVIDIVEEIVIDEIRDHLPPPRLTRCTQESTSTASDITIQKKI